MAGGSVSRSSRASRTASSSTGYRPSAQSNGVRSASRSGATPCSPPTSRTRRTRPRSSAP
ncbi:hypothetical protein ACR6C2_19935 [Streptomyces sp. INA 01156]